MDVNFSSISFHQRKLGRHAPASQNTFSVPQSPFSSLPMRLPPSISQLASCVNTRGGFPCVSAFQSFGSLQVSSEDQSWRDSPGSGQVIGLWDSCPRESLSLSLSSRNYLVQEMCTWIFFFYKFKIGSNIYHFPRILGKMLN